MRIELTYNAALYRQLSAINWKITYARSIKYSRVIVAVSLVMLCIGIYTMADAEGQTPYRYGTGIVIVWHGADVSGDTGQNEKRL